jgi:cytochrome P450
MLGKKIWISKKRKTLFSSGIPRDGGQFPGHMMGSLIVPGVEEFLRYESSVQFWPTRSALEDIEIAGTTIPKGAPIFLVYGSANRDPERFTNPDELDLERSDNEHLGFSQGIHFCFGAPLARLEVQTAVGEFVRRAENPRLVTDPPPYRHNQIFRGVRNLLVDIDGIRD